MTQFYQEKLRKLYSCLVQASRTTLGSVAPSIYGLNPGYMAGTTCRELTHNRDIVFVPRWHEWRRLHNAQCIV
jgi:hypothetical protein